MALYKWSVKVSWRWSWFEPENQWTTGQVLKKTSTWYWYGDVSSTIQVTLLSSWWSSNSQTVTATWVTSSNTVIVSPDPASFENYTTAVIYCSAQSTDSLTFVCEETPSSNITVNVVILS